MPGVCPGARCARRVQSLLSDDALVDTQASLARVGGAACHGSAARNRPYFPVSHPSSDLATGSGGVRARRPMGSAGAGGHSPADEASRAPRHRGRVSNRGGPRATRRTYAGLWSRCASALAEALVRASAHGGGGRPSASAPVPGRLAPRPSAVINMTLDSPAGRPVSRPAVCSRAFVCDNQQQERCGRATPPTLR